jgi:hypothetical protein
MRISARPRSLPISVLAKAPLHHPQWRCSSTINLTQLTLTKNPDALRQVTDLEPFLHADQDDVMIDLWSDKPHKQIKVMPLSEALRDYIKPGIALVPHRRFQQPVNARRQPAGYTLKDMDVTVLESVDVAVRRQNERPRKPENPSRRFIFGIWGSQNLDHYIRTMNSAWHLLLSGTLIEIHLQCKNRMKDQVAFRDQVSKYLHLRPDVILKSMPESSAITIKPQTNHKMCCWTMSGPYRNPDGIIEQPFDQTYKLDRKRAKLLQDTNE